MERLYIITRDDLPPGLQIPQSGHALREFVHEHPELDQVWYATSKNLVCLSVPNEGELIDLYVEAQLQGIPAAKFHEPDLGGELTAIALSDQAKKLLRRLPLALAA